jgi:hypothetical protein
VEQLSKSNQEPSLSAASPTDDEDSWCEPTGMCTRLISDYIRETKANIWYGYGGETVGSYDAVLRNNLNGRQPRLTTTLIYDELPRTGTGWLPARGSGSRRRSLRSPPPFDNVGDRDGTGRVIGGGAGRTEPR